MNKIIYLHRRKTDGLPFYIGRGNQTRAFDFSNRSKKWNTVKDEHDVLVEILHEGLSEQQSKDLEISEIANFRKEFPGSIINEADGGDSGPSKGVRLFFTNEVFLMLKGYKAVVENGFSYSDVLRICKNQTGRTGSNQFKINGKRILFFVRHFSTTDECYEFIKVKQLLPIQTSND